MTQNGFSDCKAAERGDAVAVVTRRDPLAGGCNEPKSTIVKGALLIQFRFDLYSLIHSPPYTIQTEQSGQAHFNSPNPSLMRGLDTLCAEHNCEAIFYLLCECAYYFYLIGKILSCVSVTRSFL